MQQKPIAETVVADLKQEGKSVFKVDGEALPWWLDESGPTATQIEDGLFLVHVTILAVAAVSDRMPDGIQHAGLSTDCWPYPVIQGIEFPWLMGHDGFTYRAGCAVCPSVELSFYSRSVEGVEVLDTAPPGKYRDADGVLVAVSGPLKWPSAS